MHTSNSWKLCKANGLPSFRAPGGHVACPQAKRHPMRHSECPSWLRWKSWEAADALAKCLSE